ncbi:MAG: uracil phosphoribosyltransferase [Bacilli bacterium]
MKEIILNHPMITHKLSILRDKNTGTKKFKELISEISMILCYEATKDAIMHDITINTPLEELKTKYIDEDDYAFVPILRAGMSMVDGILKVMPNAKIGHIGLYRNEETLEPVEYYYKMPSNIESREVFILDPMLATGGSALATIKKLKKDGVKKIKFLCIIASPEGIENIKKEFDDVEIYCASKDRCLNEKGYILPGLGDAGDRVYGTK